MKKVFCENCIHCDRYVCTAKFNRRYTSTAYQKSYDIIDSIYNINKNNNCKYYTSNFWFGTLVVISVITIALTVVFIPLFLTTGWLR